MSPLSVHCILLFSSNIVYKLAASKPIGLQRKAYETFHRIMQQSVSSSVLIV
jgi:hypothetical protein